MGNRLQRRAIRRFALRDPTSFIRDLVSRPEIEKLLERRPTVSQTTVHDILEAPFLHEIPFASNSTEPFIKRVGNLSFALGIDWFNPYTNLDAKKKWTIGAIYIVCLDLPPEIRFRLENVGLLGIVPGPLEPSQEQVNHFLAPIVESFARLYDKGVWISKTTLYPEGRLIRGVIALLVADLVGAKHLAGFSSHRHTYFCHLCLLPIGDIDNFEGPWPERDLEQHKRLTFTWKLSTPEAREKISKQYGVRYSVLSELPYWNPFRQVPVDILHMSLSLLKKHAREVWHMNLTTLAGDGSFDPFHTVTDPLELAEAEHAMYTETKTNLLRLSKSILRTLCQDRGIPTGSKTKPKLLIALQDWVKYK